MATFQALDPAEAASLVGGQAGEAAQVDPLDLWRSPLGGPSSALDRELRRHGYLNEFARQYRAGT